MLTAIKFAIQFEISCLFIKLDLFEDVKNRKIKHPFHGVFVRINLRTLICGTLCLFLNIAF